MILGKLMFEFFCFRIEGFFFGLSDFLFYMWIVLIFFKVILGENCKILFVFSVCEIIVYYKYKNMKFYIKVFWFIKK